MGFKGRGRSDRVLPGNKIEWKAIVEELKENDEI